MYVHQASYWPPTGRYGICFSLPDSVICSRRAVVLYCGTLCRVCCLAEMRSSSVRNILLACLFLLWCGQLEPFWSQMTGWKWSCSYGSILQWKSFQLSVERKPCLNLVSIPVASGSTGQRRFVCCDMLSFLNRYTRCIWDILFPTLHN